MVARRCPGELPSELGLGWHDHGLSDRKRDKQAFWAEEMALGKEEGARNTPGEYGKFQGWFFNLSFSMDILGRTILQGWHFVHCHAFTSISGPKAAPPPLLSQPKGFPDTAKCPSTREGSHPLAENNGSE